jgi:hypothetical protein
MSCFTFARVDPDTLEVTLKYNTNGGDRWAPDDIECPFDFDVLADRAVRAEDGTVTLQADPQKIEDHKAALWSQLRAERNRRLAASDWTQLVDSHLSQEKKDAWAAYRQELRDLPDEVTDPTQVEWPLDPTQQVPVPPVTGSRLDGILGQV